ncbi:MAG: zinc-dependent metalloprotease [Bacteroidota bacterium]
MNVLISLVLFCLLINGRLSATTVIPFENMAAMGQASDAVVWAKAERNYEKTEGAVTRMRTQFTLVHNLSGKMVKGSTFSLQKMGKRVGDSETVIAGDMEFEVGKTYLLFLAASNQEPFWQPMMLSYGIYVEAQQGRTAYLVPSRGTLEMHTAERPDGIVPELPMVFYKDQLLIHLEEVLDGRAAWSAKSVDSQLPPNSFYPAKVAPSHCTYLGGNFRWLGFPAEAINLYSENDGDGGFNPPASVHNLVPSVINRMESNYPGIDLNYAGTINFSPNCSQNGATGSSFVNFIGGLGKRNTLIQYNDPCNEITNLSGCSGTLAIGGSYVSGTHSFDGQTWRTQQWGYVIFNNGVGSCYNQNDYEIVMIHELTHSLGLGHISPSAGPANMNPSCCSNIRDLDRQCLNYTYPGGATNPTCQNNSIVENRRPIPSGTYSTVGTISSTGLVAAGSTVAFEAQNSITLGNGFEVRSGGDFTAKIVDCSNNIQASGSESVSSLLGISVETEIREINKIGFTISPNPFNWTSQIAIELPQKAIVNLVIFDMNGQLLQSLKRAEMTDAGLHHVQVDAGLLEAGMYYAVLQVGSEVRTRKLVVVH